MKEWILIVDPMIQLIIVEPKVSPQDSGGARKRASRLGFGVSGLGFTVQFYVLQTLIASI